MPRPLRPLPLLIGLVVALVLAGCGSSGGGSSSSGTTSRIDITLSGGKVTPDGKQVKVQAGKPVTLHITADEAGQLHVHSSPEQHIDFPKGTSDKTLTIDKPGQVDVEDHALDKLIVRLVVG